MLYVLFLLQDAFLTLERGRKRLKNAKMAP